MILCQVPKQHIHTVKFYDKTPITLEIQKILKIEKNLPIQLFTAWSHVFGQIFFKTKKKNIVTPIPRNRLQFQFPRQFACYLIRQRILKLDAHVFSLAFLFNLL